MLSALFGRVRRDPRHAADELMSRLEENASLVVDDSLVAEMGVGRKALYRIIYEMVRRERMFMLADRDDRMLLMTNTEFNRFMFRRSGRTEDLPMLTLEALRVETEAETMDGEDSSLVLIVDEDSDLILEGPAASVLDDAWFTIDVAPAAMAANGTEVPEYRQSLPERKREPWPVLGDFERD